MSMIDPRTLPDDALIAALARLARVSRETTAELIAHLIVLEDRNLHLALGFNSLFVYCCRVLRLSESAAYDRLQAAGAARRFPVVLAMLADGSLHLTAVRLLAPHLNDENHLALLGAARAKTSAEVRALLAGWFPQPDVAPLVRKLPERGGARAAGVTAPAAVLASHETRVQRAAPPAPVSAAAAAGAPASPMVVAARPPAVPSRSVEPLSPGRNLIRFTSDDETVALLREAQELLSHRIASGDIASIFKNGLMLVVAEARRDRHAATGKPRSSVSPGTTAAEEGSRPAASGTEDSGSRHIPAAVQRTVWERDSGRCAFMGRAGWRCEERRFLEYHHLTPWIVGGPPSVENIALRCRAHNQHEARVYFAPIREGRSDA